MYVISRDIYLKVEQNTKSVYTTETIIAETNPQVKLRNNRKKLRFRSKLANSMTSDLDNT